MANAIYPSLKEVGEAIRVRRRRASLSQDEFAHQCGLHRTYIGAVERGERNPTYETLRTIAIALGIAVSILLVEAEALSRRQEG